MAANKVLDNPAYEVLVSEATDDTGPGEAVHVSPLYQVAGGSMAHAEVMNNPLFQGSGAEVMNNPLFQGSGAELVGITDVVLDNVLHQGI